MLHERCSASAKTTPFHAIEQTRRCSRTGCTDVIRAKFPEPHSTLRWGGTRTPALPILLVAAATIANFFVVVDDRIVLAVLVVPFLCVITILWTTEGTLALGSKWCTYCLIYSILFLAAPLWDIRRWKNDESPAPASARDEETTENFSGWSVGGSTEETKEGDIEALVAAEERGKQQARDDDVEEGWHRFVAEKSVEDLMNISRM